MTALAARPRGAARASGPLDALLAPRGVLVVGASSDPTKLGGAMAAALGAGDQPVALVNSRGAADAAPGAPAVHRDVAAAAAAVVAEGGAPDLAVLCVPAAACAGAAQECADAGVRALLVAAGGFAEAGGAGEEHQQRLLEVVRRTGLRLLGPNTSGFFVPGELRASFVPGAASLQPGRVAVVAASGGLNHALAFALQRDGVGISLGVGIGAGLDVTAADVLHHLAALAESGEPQPTGAVALHLESVPDGPALLAAVRRTTAGTPVVALVVGEHDLGGFAASHTGALATSWRTTRALLRQAGAVVVDREDDLLTAAAVLSRTRLPAAARGPGSPRRTGVGLVTAQAGPGLLVADALPGALTAAAGPAVLPELAPATRRALADLLPPLTYLANPVDTGRPGPRHAEVLATVAADPGVDVLGAYALAEPVVDLPAAAADAGLAGGGPAGVPVVLGLDGTAADVAVARRRAEELGVPAVVGPRALTTALAALAEDAHLQSLRAPGHTAGTGHTADAGPRGPEVGRGAWDEARAKDLLDALGVATPPRRLCRGARAAHEALTALAPLGDGGRVVVKVSDAAILHKSDVGGVHVGVRDAAGLDAALTALARLGDQPCLVEAMAPDGVDLVVGARRDPVFGPVVVLGVGGVATEVLADVAIASADPALVTRAQLLALPGALRCRALLEGYRGAPAADRGQLADVLAALGALLVANPHLTEVEVNPLRVTADGLLALDAVVVTAEPTAEPPSRAPSRVPSPSHREEPTP